ncbi:MAG: phage baseplate assembly protein [Kofleriaceae bacterium]
MAKPHEISIVVGHQQIGGWVEYQIDTSLVEPADSFALRRPFTAEAWRICRRDARVRVQIDGVPRVDGFIDARRWNTKDGTLEISGRDRIGRLVQESAPRSAFGGATLLAVITQLAAPWFERVTLVNTRNRRVTLGKGSKAPAFDDPVPVLKSKPKQGRIDPGQPRWQVIAEMLSRVNLIAWSSSDGKELIVGRPNQRQPALFCIRHSRTANVGQAIDIDYEESNADRFSMITAIGAGANSDSDYGENATARVGVVFDSEQRREPGAVRLNLGGSTTFDGTGRDFLYPKRLILSERPLRDNEEASRIARRDQIRRDFRRSPLRATMPDHGQLISGSTRSLFSLDTMTSVVLEDLKTGEVVVDDDFLIYEASFRGSSEGQTTELGLVPRGTEIVA